MPNKFSACIITGAICLLLFACHRTNQPAPIPARPIVSLPTDTLEARAKKFINGSVDSLLATANVMMERAVAQNDSPLLVKARLYKAHHAWRSGHYEQAMADALATLQIAERLQLLKSMAALHALMGNLHKEKQNYEMAFTAADKGMAAAIALHDTSEIIYQKRLKAMFTQGYGSLYGDESVRAKSLALHLEGLELAESSSKYERERIAYYSNISQYYVYAKAYDKTIYYGEKGIALAKKYNQLRSLTYSCNWVGMAWFMKGPKAKGLQYMQEAVNIARQLKWPFREMEIYDTYSECYNWVGDYKEALHYYTRFKVMQDSLKLLDNSKQIGQLEVEYQSKKKDDAIASLNTINTAKTTQVKWMWFSLVLMALLLIIFGWLYRTIRSKNRQIQDQSQKLTLLMRELHHRVKNNLQIVTNLLSLQASRLTDPESIQTIKIGQQRIEAMALIHRSLYEQSNLKSVNMQSYVADLVESIKQTFGAEAERVTTHLDVEVKELDVDMAMPLGLLINEWVTNAFKHAWQQVAEPVLDMSIKAGDKELILEIKDNGPGIPEALWQQPQRSFGLKLVKVLVKQLDAVAQVSTAKGAVFTVHIPTQTLNNIL